MSRKDDLDNHANQMNPNNDAYWESRGYDGRPDDWEELADQEDDRPQSSRASEDTRNGKYPFQIQRPEDKGSLRVSMVN